ANRSRRESENPARFDRTQMLNVSEYEDFAIIIFETADRRSQCDTHLLALQLLRGIIAPVNKLPGLELLFLDFPLYRGIKLLAVFAQAHSGFVTGDLQHPRLEAFALAKLADMSECFKDGFLDDLLRVGLVLQNRISNELDALKVRIDESLKLFPIASLAGADQSRFVN